MQLEIKLLTKDDLEKIIALDQICFGGLWTKGGYQREIESPRSLLLGIFRCDPPPLYKELIGMGCFWAIIEEAHLTLLGIDPDYRGQGLGELLLSHLLLQAHTWSLERATLEVRASNTTAINLYQKMGFEIAGRRKDYYPLPPEDALILWRSRLQEQEFAQKMKTIQEKRYATLLTKGWDILQSS